jgi:hypothetical protein
VQHGGLGARASPAEGGVCPLTAWHSPPQSASLLALPKAAECIPFVSVRCDWRLCFAQPGAWRSMDPFRVGCALSATVRIVGRRWPEWPLDHTTSRSASSLSGLGKSSSTRVNGLRLVRQRPYRTAVARVAARPHYIMIGKLVSASVEGCLGGRHCRRSGRCGRCMKLSVCRMADQVHASRYTCGFLCSPRPCETCAHGSCRFDPAARCRWCLRRGLSSKLAAAPFSTQ